MKNHECLCGYTTSSYDDIRKHRTHCVALRNMVYAEIRNIASKLGRAPQNRDYKAMADKRLPGIEWIVKHYGSWSSVVASLNLDAPTQADDTLARGIAEIQRLIDEVTSPLAPNMSSYRRDSAPGTPKAERILTLAGYSQNADGWRQMIADKFGIVVEGYKDVWHRGNEARNFGAWDEEITIVDASTLPPLTLTACSVREDAYRIYYLLR